jgi:hypothetical protein
MMEGQHYQEHVGRGSLQDPCLNAENFSDVDLDYSANRSMHISWKATISTTSKSQQLDCKEASW